MQEVSITSSASSKVASLIAKEENSELKLRVFVTGGGCNGFSYGFTFDEEINLMMRLLATNIFPFSLIQ